MKIPTSMSRLKGFRHLREIMAQAVWAYHRSALGTGDVEDRLAQRGVIVSRKLFRHTAMRVPTRSTFDAIIPPKWWPDLALPGNSRLSGKNLAITVA